MVLQEEAEEAENEWVKGERRLTPEVKRISDFGYQSK